MYNLAQILQSPSPSFPPAPKRKASEVAEGEPWLKQRRLDGPGSSKKKCVFPPATSLIYLIMPQTRSRKRYFITSPAILRPSQCDTAYFRDFCLLAQKTYVCMSASLGVCISKFATRHPKSDKPFRSEAQDRSPESDRPWPPVSARGCKTPCQIYFSATTWTPQPLYHVHREGCPIPQS